MASHVYQDVPESFRVALASLRNPKVRPEIVLAEVPAPSRLAPFALALNAEVFLPQDLSDTPVATGRFVVLHDPDGQPSWGGDFRVVTFAQSALEPDIGHDPMLPPVAWSWVEENVSARPDARALGGTVTAVASESFGELAAQEARVEVEIRASWTTDSDLAPHLIAWSQVLCAMAGIEPLPAGVSRI